MKSERGVATVGAVAVAFCLVTVAVVIAQAAALVGLRHRAASAADLAALAGSRASAAGHRGCATAATIAGRNGGHVVYCRMDFDVATVRVRVVGHRWWGRRWAVEQRARAAPADYVPAPSSSLPERSVDRQP